MLNEYEPKSAGIDRQFIIIGAIFCGVLIMICVLGIMFLNQKRESRPTAQQEAPVLIIPTASLPQAIPANQRSIHMPVILSASGSGAEPMSAPATEQVWKVTKIKSLGYEKDGQFFDLATFQRVNSQDTVKAYCINQGSDTPEVGTEYLLGAGGILVPLSEPADDPLQRFLIVSE